jgi:WD repeat-containing protein 26
MEVKLNKTEANEKEILEMILQFFYENRYMESAKLLESKANIIYDQDEIQQLKLLLKNHKFDESLRFLEKSNFENIQKAEVLKILKSRKFLELLKLDLKEEALNFLRKEITPLYSSNQSNLHKYSVLLFSSNREALEKLIKQYFNDINTDESLINKIQSMLCLSLDSHGNRILPNSRLEHMLNSYAENQMDIDDEGVCYNHDYSKDCESLNCKSKVQQHKTHKSIFNFPKNLIIEKHDDEVWHIELSSSSKYLCTCSKNGMIAIFSLEIITRDGTNNYSLDIKCINYFQSHKKYVSSLAWSKNEKFILTSSADKTLKLWDPFQGKNVKTFQLHTDIVTSVKWLNEETFVSGGIDKKMIICTTGNRVLCSETFSRIRKVLYSESQNCLIIIPASMNDIVIFDHKNYTEIHRITELDPIISSNLSIKDDGRYLITNLSKVNASINLYDLNNFQLINKYYGHTQEQYTIECSFAGKNDEFIICGSEDASVYIWSRF